MELIPLIVTSILFVILPPLPYIFLSTNAARQFSHFTSVFIIPLLFFILWGILIYMYKGKNKTLWRFALEWSAVLAYLLFCMVAYGNVRVAFNPYDSLGGLCLIAFLPLIGLAEHIPENLLNIVFPLLFAVPIIACLFFIIKNYRETGKLW